MDKDISENVDLEVEIYKLLNKIQKNNQTEEFHKFNNQVIKDYFHENNKINLNYLIKVIKTCAKDFPYFYTLNQFEQELIATMLWGTIKK